MIFDIYSKEITENFTFIQIHFKIKQQLMYNKVMLKNHVVSSYK